MQTILLPQGTTIRPATSADLPTFTTLIRLCQTEMDGLAETTLDDMQVFLRSPGVNLATDSWLVFSETAQLIAMAIVSHRQQVSLFFGYNVHPMYRGQGIEEHLLQLCEERAQQLEALAPLGMRVWLGTNRSSKDSHAQQFLEDYGFTLIRHFWRMAIKLNDAPPIAPWAEGIQLHMFTPDMEQAVYEADEEAFKDHWGHVPTPFDEWKNWNMNREHFDPTLWFLAMDGEEIAGFALCQDDKENGGWVHVLGVRRPWRCKSIGLSLLQHAFGEFYRRGIQDVYLSVDAQSLTGATRLYERAGMHADRKWYRYEKELRAGKELSTISLDV